MTATLREAGAGEGPAAESTPEPPTTTQAAPKPRPARRRAVRPGHLASYLVLCLMLVLICFPVYYAIVGSVMGPADINSFPSSLWPEHGLRWDNFAKAMGAIPLLRQYGVSLAMAGVIVAGQIATSVLAAYAIVFLPLRRRSAWFAFFMATMMVPGEAIIIPNYLTVSDLGLRDNFLALVLPFLATGFGVFLLRQAFLSFPTELLDAARIDGCGHGRLLALVLLPLSKPTLAALGIWSFLSAWNMFLWPLLVTETPQMQTIQIGVTQLRSADNFNAGLVMAGTVLAIVPTLLLVILGQKYIVRGLTAGALK